MKYSLLVKGIVDSVFTISGGKLEEMNTNPEILFDMLEGYRKTFTTMESLVDRFIIANAGIEMYMKYQELETIEERMALTALLEISTDIILEERWEMSRKIGGDVNLSFDKNFRKYYDDGKGKMDQLIGESQRELGLAMRRDKKLQKLGINRKINTSQENRDLSDT